MKAYIKRSVKPGFYIISRFPIDGSITCKYTRGFKFLIVATETDIFRINFEKVIF